jgi:lysylphosphatidylglycerol synthetase-like protein (DUF2156 family)
MVPGRCRAAWIPFNSGLFGIGPIAGVCVNLMGAGVAGQIFGIIAGAIVVLILAGIIVLVVLLSLIGWVFLALICTFLRRSSRSR